MNQSNNGNEQINSSRRDHNSRVMRLRGIGGTKGFAWKSRRRNRAI